MLTFRQATTTVFNFAENNFFLPDVRNSHLELLLLFVVFYYLYSATVAVRINNGQ